MKHASCTTNSTVTLQSSKQGEKCLDGRLHAAHLYDTYRLGSQPFDGSATLEDWPGDDQTLGNPGMCRCPCAKLQTRGGCHLAKPLPWAQHLLTWRFGPVQPVTCCSAGQASRPWLDQGWWAGIETSNPVGWRWMHPCKQDSPPGFRWPRPRRHGLLVGMQRVVIMQVPSSRQSLPAPSPDSSPSPPCFPPSRRRALLPPTSLAEA